MTRKPSWKGRGCREARDENLLIRAIAVYTARSWQLVISTPIFLLLLLLLLRLF